ncbi:hypothetical protein NQ317_016423, partial [Molorchus minor]
KPTRSNNTDDFQRLEKKIEEEPKTEIKKKPTAKQNVISDRNKISEQESRVPFYIRNNLRSLIGQCPEGIWCADLPQKYRKMFRQELNFCDLGYNNLIDLCVCLSSIFHYVRPSMDDFKLYDKSKPLPDCAEKRFTMASYTQRDVSGPEPATALPNIEWSDVNTFLSEDIFQLGDEIPRAFFSRSHVVVAEIYDPSKFWLYLSDSPLDNLMDQMQEFYKYKAAEYTIPHHLIREGLYCVQVIYGEYHRALIVDTMPDVDQTIRVIFIDYGTMSKVSTIGLSFLHKQFSTLPAQAIRSRLGEGMPWSREASKAYRRMITGRDTVAKIVGINWEEQILTIMLMDITEQDNTFYINDKLVEEGYARLPEQEPLRPLVNPVHTTIVKNLHLFPTFLELEHGMAPSTLEVEIFDDCNVPINFCYPQYFSLDFSSEEEAVKHTVDFYDKNVLGLKRSSPQDVFDVEASRAQPVDMTVLGGLESEIAAFLGEPPDEYYKNNSDEDFIDAEEEEDLINLHDESNGSFDLPTTQFRELGVTEEKAVEALKEDLKVTEDIMKDINFLCGIENFDLSGHLRQDESVKVENNLTLGNDRELWTINESKESFDMTNQSGSLLKSDSGSDSEFYDPLSTMQFENDYSSVGSNLNNIYDLCEPKPQAESSNINLFTGESNLVRDRLSGDEFLTQIFNFCKADLPQSDSNKTDDCSSETPVQNTIASTNPFLSDINGHSDNTDQLSLGQTTLNLNNPFLSYVPNKEPNSGSSSSSTSTVYDSPVVQVKSVHAWSHFEDLDTDTVSQLGRALTNKSSSSNSARMSEDRYNNCSTSTQTSAEQVRGVPVDYRPSFPQYYPQPMAYYSHWSLGYANPHYMQFHSQYEPHGPLYRGPSVPPGFPPPPGFPAAPPMHPPNYGPMPHMPQYFPPNNVPRQVNMQPLNYGPKPLAPSSAGRLMSGGSAVSSVSVRVVGDNKDFYDVYNEQLGTVTTNSLK